MNDYDNFKSQGPLQLADVRVAFALLTRLPLPFPTYNPNRPAAMAAWAYPLVGVAVACVMMLIIWMALILGLSTSIAALLALGASILITGAMHEDGLADCADGFWGGWTIQRRLEIMKDSQIGTYGVLALVLSFGLRWQLTIAVIEADLMFALIPAAVLSRSAMTWVMYAVAHARRTGLSYQTGKPQQTAIAVALGLGILSAILVAGASAFVTLMTAAITTFGISKLARSKIGGQTGDVLGATQQVIEIATLGSLIIIV